MRSTILRRTTLLVLLAVLGVAAAVGLGLAANAISGDSIGLSAEPLRAGDELAPPAAREEGGERTRSTTTDETTTATTPTTSTPTTTDGTTTDSGDDGGGSGGDESGRGRGRNRGRGSDD